MSKIIDFFQNIISWIFSKIFNINWDLRDVFQEDDNELTDEDYSNCCRHGGVASIINCWECSAEFRDDDIETEDNDADE